MVTDLVGFTSMTESGQSPASSTASGFLPAAIASDDRAVSRFVREARAAGKLAHPHVVSVYSIGVKEQGFNELPYAAMVSKKYGLDASERVVEDARVALDLVAGVVGEELGPEGIERLG